LRRKKFISGKNSNATLLQCFRVRHCLWGTSDAALNHDLVTTLATGRCCSGEIILST